MKVGSTAVIRRITRFGEGRSAIALFAGREMPYVQHRIWECDKLPSALEDALFNASGEENTFTCTYFDEHTADFAINAEGKPEHMYSGDILRIDFDGR